MLARRRRSRRTSRDSRSAVSPRAFPDADDGSPPPPSHYQTHAHPEAEETDFLTKTQTSPRSSSSSPFLLSTRHEPHQPAHRVPFRLASSSHAISSRLTRHVRLHPPRSASFRLPPRSVVVVAAVVVVRNRFLPFPLSLLPTLPGASRTFRTHFHPLTHQKKTLEQSAPCASRSSSTPPAQPPSSPSPPASPPPRRRPTAVPPSLRAFPSSLSSSVPC